jgi:hypothetical protein
MNALDKYHGHRNHEGMLLQAVGGWLVINSLLRK